MRFTHNPFEHLLSKLVAGGLSAGIVLAWWPAFFSHDSIASWCWRGLIWTLLFELLLGALSPLENAAKSSRAAVSANAFLSSRLRRVRNLVPRSPAASGGVLVAAAIALPAGLIISGSREVQQPSETQSVNITQNRKIIKPVKVVKVTKVVSGPAAQPAASSIITKVVRVKAPAKTVAKPTPKPVTPQPVVPPEAPAVPIVP